MGAAKPEPGRGTLLLVLGVLAIVGAVLVLVFERIALLSQLLLLVVAMAVMGATKVVAAARAGHVAWYVRVAGFVVGGLFILLAAIALFNPIFGFFLVILMFVVGLMVYGAERIGIGIDSTLPRRERLFSLGVGIAGIAAALALLFVGDLEDVTVALITISVAVILAVTGVSFILSGIGQRRTTGGPAVELPWSGLTARRAEGAPRPAPEQRLHCFVVASRAEIIASLGRLVRKSKPKVQQGGLEATRNANLSEGDLFRLLRAYARTHGDLDARESPAWEEIHATFETYRKRSTVRKFQWVRPVGALTSKARIARVGYALRQTPLDLRSTRRHGLAPIGIGAMGGGLAHLAATVRQTPGRVPKELMERIEAEFGLLQGGLRSYGAYILHVVGAPADVDSDDLGDLFVDDVPLLWDFGASHTEVGALDPADHLLSATTNFLLGPAILFQHFYTEGRPVAFARRGDRVQVGWAGRRRVVHRSDELDVEKGFKRGDVTVPTAIARAADLNPVLPPERLEVRGIDSRAPEPGGPAGANPAAAIGITSSDLREAGIERLDWNLVYMMMEGEFAPRTRGAARSPTA